MIHFFVIPRINLISVDTVPVEAYVLLVLVLTRLAGVMKSVRRFSHQQVDERGDCWTGANKGNNLTGEKMGTNLTGI